MRPGSPARAAVLALCGALALAACGRGGPDPQLLGLEGRDREALDATYPLGTPRDVIRAREADALVFSVHECNLATRERDPGLSAAIEAFRYDHPDEPLRCDRLRLARPGWVTLIGGMAYYQDYVFYDADEQVLDSYRTFLQRSAQKEQPAGEPAP